MQIFVKTISGRIIPLEVDSGDHIEIVKAAIHEHVGIRPWEQHPILDRDWLDDGLTLADNNVWNGCTLDLEWKFAYRWTVYGSLNALAQKHCLDKMICRM